MKTNNDNLKAKISFRKNYATEADNVLDCFAGQNQIWSRVPHADYLGIDLKFRGVLNNIKGDSYRIIPSLDISSYSIIDIDCYGLPWKMLHLVMNNPTLPNKVRFFLTHIAYVSTEREEDEVFKKIRSITRSMHEEVDRWSYEHELRNYTKEYDYYMISFGAMRKRYMTFLFTK